MRRVAGGTSLPELASSINAVITNHADLAVGAVIGLKALPSVIKSVLPVIIEGAIPGPVGNAQ